MNHYIRFISTALLLTAFTGFCGPLQASEEHDHADEHAQTEEKKAPMAGIYWKKAR